MEKLQNLLNKASNFEELTNLILDKKILNIAKEYLESLHLDFKINKKELLGLWVMYKHSEDTMGNNYDQNLYNTVEKIFTIKDNKEYLKEGVIMFRKWLRKDKDLLINDLFYAYHNLGVDMLNASKDSAEYIKKARKEILKSAKNIAGQSLVDEIMNYKPVVIDIKKLNTIAEKAFWDNIKESYKNKKYDWVYFILEHILNLLSIINPNSKDKYQEIIDISFIKQQVDNDAFEDSQMVGIAYALLDMTKEVHAPIFDDDIQKTKEDIDKNGLNLSEFLKDIVQRLELIIKMILKFKK